MRPKILFLGTGGDISVVGKQQRAAGGIVIQSDDCQFIIDPGPGALLKAAQYGINIRETTGILVSHNHTNHANDVPALISAMTLNGLDARGVLFAAESVQLSSFHSRCLEKIIQATPGKKIAIETAEIHALNAKHNDEKTVGFKLMTHQFVVAYTSDTEYDKALAEQYKGAEILILNVVHPEKTKEMLLSANDAVKIIKKAEPKVAVITHFGSKMLSANPVYIAREIQKQTGTQVVAADDGIVIDPVSYSAELKQKTLSMFKKAEEQDSQQDSQA